MAKILITGGTGYIGSHTAVELLNNNHEIFIIDNLSNSKIQVLEYIQKITGKKPQFYLVDLKNKQQIADFCKNHAPFDLVIHMAAFKFVAESIQKPLLYYHNNLSSTINLLQAIHDFCPNAKLLFSSSCTVYGMPDFLPLTEEHPLKIPTSPYGKTKQFMELAIKDLTNALDNFYALSLRYFNPIGAHESLLIGESPLKTYNLMPLLVAVAAGKIPVFKIYGSDYPTPDGTPIRDYIHIMDLAHAHALAVDYLLNNPKLPKYSAFNIGLGKGFSVLQIIKKFEQISGKKINYIFAPRRPGDVPEIYASAEKAKKILNWKPKYSLHDMIKTAWLWEINKKF